MNINETYQFRKTNAATSYICTYMFNVTTTNMCVRINIFNIMLIITIVTVSGLATLKKPLIHPKQFFSELIN